MTVWLNRIGIYSLQDILSIERMGSIVEALLILLVFIILKELVQRYFFPVLQRMSEKTPHKLDDRILQALAKPLESLLLFSGIYLALKILIQDPGLEATVIKLYRSMIIGFIAWALYNATHTELMFSDEFKQKFKIDEILVPLLSQAIRFVILALAVVIIIQEWGYRVDGLIAGLGLGGLAVALAAQETISNLFAGIVIITDKPFSIGDWIETPSVQGTVEDISFRSTKVRAFNQAVITVPNSTLAGEAITNYTRMGKRRINFQLGVTYDTPRSKLQECTTRIRQMLADHPEVHPETIMVIFDVFNDCSLGIFVYFFTNTTIWADYLQVKEDINYRIMDILHELKISVAFPTRSIYFENPAVLKNTPADSAITEE